jgi:hypothetical protein
MTLLRRIWLTSALLAAVLTHAGSARAAAPVELEAAPAVLSAARALGADVRFFTSARHPLRRLSELTEPQKQIASPHLGLARGLMGLLRAGGARLDPNAAELMTLVGERHLSRVFTGSTRLVLVRASEAALVVKAGGVPVVFRGPGGVVGADEPAKASAATPTAVAPAASAATSTSFGDLVSARLAPSAHSRHADTGKIDTLPARSGQQFLVLTIARDFGRGVGAVSFLYGSGIIIEPAFDQLVIEADGKRLTPRAVNAAGLTVELGYELPATAKKLTLIDGDVRAPLSLTPGA